MNTTKILVNVHDDQKMIRLHDEEITFNLFEFMNQPKDEKSCFQIDVLTKAFVPPRSNYLMLHLLRKPL